MDTDANNPDDPGTSRARPIVAVQVTTEMAKAAKKTADQRLAARVAKAKANLASKAVATVPLQLPLWPDAARAVPNAVLRGALFGISQVRDVIKTRTLIASVKGIEIRFMGQRLNQTDLDVWETLVHLARDQQLGSRVQFTAHALLTALGRHHGKAQHEQLKDDIGRLATSLVEVTFTEHGKVFGAAMVQRYYRDEASETYVIELSPDLFDLYQTGYTQIDWAERQQLGSAGLAKWLHGFYSSHAAPLPYKVATIRDLCGADPAQRLADFRRLLRAALDLLVAKTTCITSWKINEHDCVVVTRQPSPSQRRHLARLLR